MVMNGEVKNAFGVLEGMQIKKPDTQSKDRIKQLEYECAELQRENAQLTERCKKLASRVPEWPKGYRPGRRPSNNNTRPRHQERTNNDRRPN
jgi:hypothetical protein|tara:strand:- start:2396 stop:2671 length:276 start_codon:yes stop_codon:yes gene_type:complete